MRARVGYFLHREAGRRREDRVWFRGECEGCGHTSEWFSTAGTVHGYFGQTHPCTKWDQDERVD